GVRPTTAEIGVTETPKRPVARPVPSNAELSVYMTPNPAVADVGLTVYGLDLIASRRIPLHALVSISPYVGVSGYVSMSDEKSEVVDLRNEPLQECTRWPVRLRGSRSYGLQWNTMP